MSSDRPIKKRKRLNGGNDQEYFMYMITSRIEDVVNNPRGSIRIFTTQAINDALEKRNTVFSKLMEDSGEEIDGFLKDVVINTIKRAKLVEYADKIIPECKKFSYRWNRRQKTLRK